MKKKTIVTALAVAGCLTTMAQPALQIDNPRQWVGELKFKSKKAVSFHLSNTGDQPLQIHEVHPSCGCIVATVPEQPIEPGEEAEITATFDATTLGTFYRELAVYNNATDEPAYLGFEGRVVAELSDVDYETNFPINLGSIRLNTNVVEFDDVNRGDRPMAELLVMNMKKEDFAPQLMHLPDYVTVECLPQMIQGGRVGRVRLTLDSDKLQTNGLHQASIYMSRYEGDQVGQDNEILLAAVLLPSFEGLSEEELDKAPRMVLTDADDTVTTDVTLPITRRKFWKREQKASKVLQVRNTGDTELNISALQVMNRAVRVSLGNRVVPARGTTKLTVSIDLKELPTTKNRPRLLIISNDPRHAKTILSFTIAED